MIPNLISYTRSFCCFLCWLLRSLDCWLLRSALLETWGDNFTFGTFDGDEDLQQNLLDTCLKEVFFKISGWMLYNVWSSFLEVRLWERRRRYQPIQSLRRRSPENTGTGDEEVPLSHSLNFSSIVVFVRPSSSFSNSLSLSSILRPNEGR